MKSIILAQNLLKIFLLMGFCIYISSAYPQEEDSKELQLSYFKRVPILTDFKFNLPCALNKDIAGNFYVLDTKDSKLYVFDPSWKLKGHISQPGSGQKDLDHPIHFAFDSKERVYIIDANNFRIQVFEKTGEHSRSIPLDSTTGGMIALNNKDELIFNQPRKGNLFFIYSPEGKFIKKFGELMALSHAYPDKNEDKKYKVPLSRVRVALDSKDNIYVSYIFAPILQKYDPSGNLLWEKRLWGDEIHSLTKIFWEAPRSVDSMSMDGIQMAIICKDISLDIKTNRIYTLLGDGKLYITDTNGKKLFTLKEKREKPSFNLDSVRVIGKEIYGTSLEGCFKIEFLNKN